MRVFVLSLAAGLLFAGVAIAGDCCSQPACCGKTCCGQMACKVVCDMKEVKKHVWVVECEPICVPLPGCKKSCCGCKAGCGCDTGCCDAGGCGCCECDPCAELLSRPMVKPKCCKLICRKKLVKKEIVCEVPTYKCVVVSCGCGGCCDSHESAAPAKEEKSAIKAAPLPPQSVA